MGVRVWVRKKQRQTEEQARQENMSFLPLCFAYLTVQRAFTVCELATLMFMYGCAPLQKRGLSQAIGIPSFCIGYILFSDGLSPACILA